MAEPSWAKHVADVLRRNDIRLFATVPDYIVSHVLDELWTDSQCRVVTTTREEEAVGLLSGAWLAGHRRAADAEQRARQLHERARLAQHDWGQVLKYDISLDGLSMAA